MWHRSVSISVSNWVCKVVSESDFLCLIVFTRWHRSVWFFCVLSEFATWLRRLSLYFCVRCLQRGIVQSDFLCTVFTTWHHPVCFSVSAVYNVTSVFVVCRCLWPWVKQRQAVTKLWPTASRLTPNFLQWHWQKMATSPSARMISADRYSRAVFGWIL